MALSHCKLCELEDFSDPELRELMRKIFTPDVARLGADFPTGREYRKYWEVALWRLPEFWLRRFRCC